MTTHSQPVLFQSAGTSTACHRVKGGSLLLLAVSGFLLAAHRMRRLRFLSRFRPGRPGTAQRILGWLILIAIPLLIGGILILCGVPALISMLIGIGGLALIVLMVRYRILIAVVGILALVIGILLLCGVPVLAAVLIGFGAPLLLLALLLLPVIIDVKKHGFKIGG